MIEAIVFLAGLLLGYNLKKTKNEFHITIKNEDMVKHLKGIDYLERVN